MAPVFSNDHNQPVHREEGKSSWTVPTIVVGAVFLFLLLAFVGTTIAFCIHKRHLRKQLPPQNQRRSYHPFRTESTDKSSLLADVQTPEDERPGLFSREPSGVSLYVDAEPAPVNKRVVSASMETINLIPLHVTPAERQNSLAGQISNGSGVSAPSSRTSRPSISLSPIQQEDGDLAVRVARPRSTSTSSVRYYGRRSSSSPDGIVAPPLPSVPTIIRTESD